MCAAGFVTDSSFLSTIVHSNSKLQEATDSGETSMRVAEGVRTAVNQDGAVVLHIGRGLLFSFNPVASKIWEELATGHSEEQIADHLVASFGISPNQALLDVHEFVEQLEAQQLLRPAESEGSRNTLGPKPQGLVCSLPIPTGSASDKPSNR